MKILLVEDEEGITIYVRRLLEPRADIVQAVRTLGECYTLITRDRYDVIIIDLRLVDAAPSLTIAEIPKIRREQPDAAIIVQSGLGEQYRERSIEAGADMFLPKTPEQLERSAFFAAIATALQKRGTGKGLADNMEMLRMVAEHTCEH